MFIEPDDRRTPRSVLRMKRFHAGHVRRACALSIAIAATASHPFAQPGAKPGTNRFSEQPLVISAADCTTARLGTSIPADAIGEPVSSVTLGEPRWVPAEPSLPPRCEIDGRMAPIDPAATARPINFRVWLPAEWNRRAVQQGGGGMNGVIPDLRGAPYPIDGRSPAQWGFVTYGSDSGHQAGLGRRGGPPRAAAHPPRPPDGARRRAGARRAVAGGTRRRTSGRSTTRRSGTSATCS